MLRFKALSQIKCIFLSTIEDTYSYKHIICFDELFIVDRLKKSEIRFTYCGPFLFGYTLQVQTDFNCPVDVCLLHHSESVRV